MAHDPLDLYDDVIVIPFEIPWRISSDPDPEPVAQQPVEVNAPDMGQMSMVAAPTSPTELDRRYRELEAQAARPNWSGPEPGDQRHERRRDYALAPPYRDNRGAAARRAPARPSVNVLGTCAADTVEHQV